jgi:hypothetical protein
LIILASVIAIVILAVLLTERIVRPLSKLILLNNRIASRLVTLSGEDTGYQVDAGKLQWGQHSARHAHFPMLKHF